MANTFVNKKTGKPFTRLNPAEKAKKYATELRNKKRYSNDYEVKQDGLTCCQTSWRSGYLAARKDSSACYKAQQRKKNK